MTLNTSGLPSTNYVALREKIEAWIKSPEGKKSMEVTMEEIKEFNRLQDQKRREDIEWLAEHARKPMTI